MRAFARQQISCTESDGFEMMRILQTCPQYIAVGPTDLSSWPGIKSKLQGMMNDNYSMDTLLEFMEQRYKEKGYENIRVLRKIKTEYFWSSTTNFILNCLVNDSEQISSNIHILNGEQATTMKLTKYQIFLILGHMFIGTFPPQLHTHDVSFGQFMEVLQEEDQVHCKDLIQFRLNKLKSIAKYFCVFKKRSQQTPEINKQVVIYQRTYLPENSLDILDNTNKFCNVEVRISQDFQEDRQLNKISINNIGSVQGGILPPQPTPGGNIYSNQDMNAEERIFFSHPQMLIFPLILPTGLGKYQTFVVHGAEKYIKHYAISRHTQFDFKMRYYDQSLLHKTKNFKNTTHIFVYRQVYKKRKYGVVDYKILPDIMKVCSALKYTSQIRPTTDVLQSSKFTSIQRPKNLHFVVQIPWQIKFLVDWVSASVMNYTNFQFYVDNEVEATDVKIVVKEMKNYNVRDVVSVLESYYQFMNVDRGKLDFFQFLRDFVL